MRIDFYDKSKNQIIKGKNYTLPHLWEYFKSKLGMAVVNPNLLDNGWFEVNTRGITSVSSAGYFVDRWYSRSAGVVVNSDNTITVPTAAIIHTPITPQLSQYLNGKQVTYSIMLSDGTIKKTTFEWASSGDYQVFLDGQSRAWIANYSTYTEVRFYDGAKSNTIKAIKLELGSVSTLQLDSAPPYAEELIRCQGSTVATDDTYANKGVATESLWNASTSYTVGQAFIYNGIRYRVKANCSNIKPPNSTYYDAVSIDEDMKNFYLKYRGLYNFDFVYANGSGTTVSFTEHYRGQKIISINTGAGTTMSAWNLLVHMSTNNDAINYYVTGSDTAKAKLKSVTYSNGVITFTFSETTYWFVRGIEFRQDNLMN